MPTPVTADDYIGSVPVTSISCPDDGEKVKADDIRAPVAALLANDDYIINDATDGLAAKVAKAGDTMTGALTITPSGSGVALSATGGSSSGRGVLGVGGATNGTGVEGQGTGTGSGVFGTGGATNGTGGDFTGAGNGRGVSAAGAGSGVGVFATGGNGGGAGVSATGGIGGAGVSATGGSAGPGVIAANGTAQTATAPTEAIRSAGYLRMTGADPNAGVDPGANNALHGANIIKTWVTFDDTYAILDGYNVASITNVLGSIYKVTFVRAMANVNYGVKIHVHGAVGYSGALNSNKTVNDFEFTLFKTTDLSLGFGVATNAFIEITGRQ